MHLIDLGMYQYTGMGR